MTRCAFIGAGRWALALALRLHKRDIDVALYDNSEPTVRRLLQERLHPDLPADCLIPDDVLISHEPALVMDKADVVVFAVPSAALARAAAGLRGLIPDSAVVVSVTKGIDPESLERLSVVLARSLARRNIVVLAGPGIPYDFAAGDPTSLVAASEDEDAARMVRDGFTGSNLRIYSLNDTAGVELGAAFKNVIAIAAGVCDGLGLGINAKAALLTRGLAEVTRLGLAMNCNPLTFSGLSGMGDLIVTAFSEHSRNHTLGLLVGRGETFESVRASLAGVAEGAATAESGRRLATRLSVEMPITEEVYRMLYEKSPPQESVGRLLRRRPKNEVWR
uniref:Glycerol-3-phosphate dehydrogenase [NAD(P)+] n=1 Tax=candidate division WOR-3 bacterium TaxID=2052148 RepID=A0A7C4CCZ5_UNCW3